MLPSGAVIALAIFGFFLQEGLEVGCVLVDQLVQRLQRTFHAAADELVLQAIAADDVGQLAGGHQQVVLLAAVGRHLARGIDQLDVGEAGQLLGHRPVFVPHVLVAEVHVDAEIQGLAEIGWTACAWAGPPLRTG